MNMKKPVPTLLLGAALTAALILPASAAGASCSAASASAVNCPENFRTRLCSLWQTEDGSFSGCNRLPDCLLSQFSSASEGSDSSDNTQAADTEETPTESETPDTAQSGSDSVVSPAPDSSTASSVSAYEQEVVDLVNEIRAEYGLSALTLSEELCDGARLKSEDMRQNGYFSHESPTYGTPFEMMQSLGISYSAAAENIALGQSTPEEVVNAWMNSEGHRANILSDRYTQIGVGYVADGNYWTQWFVG